MSSCVKLCAKQHSVSHSIAANSVAYIPYRFVQNWPSLTATTAAQPEASHNTPVGALGAAACAHTLTLRTGHSTSQTGVINCTQTTQQTHNNNKLIILTSACITKASRPLFNKCTGCHPDAPSSTTHQLQIIPPPPPPPCYMFQQSRTGCCSMRLSALASP